MAALEKRVAALLDREAIRTLANLYCHAVWACDPDAFAALWTEDGELVINGAGGSRVVAGRANLRAMIADSIQNRPPAPLVHNHVVELVSAKRAVGQAHVEVLSRTNGYLKTATAHYRDEYRKIAGEWRFQRRHLRFLSMSAAIEAAYGKDSDGLPSSSGGTRSI